MKIRKQKEFQPVVIILETEEEVKIFHEVGNYRSQISKLLSGNIGSLDEKDADNILLELYQKL